MSAIVVVLPKLEDAKKIRKILVGHGFQNVFACVSGSLALSTINQYACGLVISGYHLKDMYYLELLDQLPKYFEMVLLGKGDAAAETSLGVLSLTTPLKVYDLVNTADMVLRQLERRIKKDRTRKKRSEKEENYIRNAKFLLMERNQLSEEEAYRYIQKCSMDNGTNMVETAQMILTCFLETD